MSWIVYKDRAAVILPCIEAVTSRKITRTLTIQKSLWHDFHKFFDFESELQETEWSSNLENSAKTSGRRSFILN